MQPVRIDIFDPLTRTFAVCPSVASDRDGQRAERSDCVRIQQIECVRVSQALASCARCPAPDASP